MPEPSSKHSISAVAHSGEAGCEEWWHSRQGEFDSLTARSRGPLAGGLMRIGPFGTQVYKSLFEAPIAVCHRGPCKPRAVGMGQCFGWRPGKLAP